MKKKKNEKDIQSELTTEDLQQDTNVKSDETIEEKMDSPTAEQLLQDEVKMLNDKYLRLAAEFDNFRRRTLKEKQDLVIFASEEIIRGILPVLDDFERATEMLSAAGDESKTALEGTELIHNKLKTFLSSKGVKEIDTAGCELDTDYHEAVAQIPVEDKKMKNRIVDVVQKGYTLNGKVIRYAKVVMGH